MRKQSIPIRYGVSTGVVLIVYFLLLAIVGLNSNPAFSFFNAVITAGGIYLSIKSYRRHKSTKFRYQKGFMAGIFTGFYATVIFTIFFAIYFANNDAFAQALRDHIIIDTNAGLLIFGVALMGFASTMVVTLSLMQLFKDSWNTKDGNRHTYSENKNFPSNETKKKQQATTQTSVPPHSTAKVNPEK